MTVERRKDFSDLAGVIGRIEGKQDLLIDGMKRVADKVDTNFTDLHTKISNNKEEINKLKVNQAWWAGAAAAAGVSLTKLIDLIRVG